MKIGRQRFLHDCRNYITGPAEVPKIWRMPNGHSNNEVFAPVMVKYCWDHIWSSGTPGSTSTDGPEYINQKPTQLVTTTLKLVLFVMVIWVVKFPREGKVKFIHFLNNVVQFMKTRYFSWCQLGIAWKSFVKVPCFHKMKIVQILF